MSATRLACSGAGLGTFVVALAGYRHDLRARFVSIDPGGHALTPGDPDAHRALGEFPAAARLDRPLESSALTQGAPS
jgi:hypothetical protein